MSGALRLVADDLTGALDAAAPFASARNSVAVFRDPSAAAAHDGPWAYDAATRGGDLANARDSAARIAPAMRGGLAFRKIDSLLRGHTAAEIAATARAGGFASVIIAPAFPGQGRVTRQGRHFSPNLEGNLAEVAPDFVAQLAAHGLAPRLAKPDVIEGAGTFLCDAETDADLAAIATAGRKLKLPVLWCGASGLARALAGDTKLAACPAGPALGIVGSRHPVAAAEIDRLRARSPGSVLLIDTPGSLASNVASAANKLRAASGILLALRLPDLPADKASAVLVELANAAASLNPALLFASGGDTLAAAMTAVGAPRLDVVGEIAPGMPLSRIAGGKWDGMPVVSRSGAFAGEAMLEHLFANPREKQRAQA